MPPPSPLSRHAYARLRGRSERADVEMWNRRLELVLFAHIGRYFQHTSEIFKTRIKQMPEVAEVPARRRWCRCA